MAPSPLPDPVFFSGAGEFRAWLETHHATATDIWVGFRKKSTDPGGLAYPQAVDEALCFGWIDGRVRSLGSAGCCRRFTPRRSGSIWSNANVRHVARLAAAGRMHAAGLAAFAARTPGRTGIYSFENPPGTFPAALARRFRTDRAAWTFWLDQPPGYRRQMTHYVCSAKRDATRERRLDRLRAACAAGRRLA